MVELDLGKQFVSFLAHVHLYDDVISKEAHWKHSAVYCLFANVHEVLIVRQYRKVSFRLCRVTDFDIANNIGDPGTNQKVMDVACKVLNEIPSMLCVWGKIFWLLAHFVEVGLPRVNDDPMKDKAGNEYIKVDPFNAFFKEYGGSGSFSHVICSRLQCFDCHLILFF